MSAEAFSQISRVKLELTSRMVFYRMTLSVLLLREFYHRGRLCEQRSEKTCLPCVAGAASMGFRPLRLPSEELGAERSLVAHLPWAQDREFKSRRPDQIAAPLPGSAGA